MSGVLDQLAAELEKVRRARRVLLVHPGDYGPVVARVYTDGMSSMVEVQQSKYVQPGTVILLNPNIDVVQ